MSKLDCSNVFVFQREWERRRKYNKKLGGYSPGISELRVLDINGDYVKDLQEWSDNNPRQTRKEKFIKMCDKNGFGTVADHFKEYGCKVPCMFSDCDKCKEYWNEEV